MVTISTVQRSYRQVPNLESRMSRESVLIGRLVTLGVKVHAAYRIARCSPFSVVADWVRLKDFATLGVH